MTIYLDNSATTRPFDETIAQTVHYMDTLYYNPSALYQPSVDIRQRMQAVRELFARDMRIASHEVYFHSGGTEGNNMVTAGVVNAVSRQRKLHIVSSLAEHASIREPMMILQKMGHHIDFIGTDGFGRYRLDELKYAVRPDTALVSLMHVNNESGAVNDIAGLARTVKEQAPHAVFHCDGVQAYPKLPLPVAGVDAYTVSAHKFHGPRGVGMLYLRQGVACAPLIRGGGQEMQMRAGTENTPGIAGMGAALQKYIDHRTAYIENLRCCKRRLYDNLQSLPDIHLNGPPVEEGAPHILSIGFAGVNAQPLMQSLEQKGVYVGLGSACSSHNKTVSPVLTAMKIDERYARGTIRFGICCMNTPEEMDEAAQAVTESVQYLRRYSRR